MASNYKLIFNHFRGRIWSRSQLTDTEAHADEFMLASSGPLNKENIFLGLIEYDLNSLRGALYVSSYSIGLWKIFAK